MATEKPRIQVMLPRQTYEVIRRLGELQGRSMSAVVADLLDGVAPALTRTVALLEAAMQGPEEVKARLARAGADIERDIRAALGGSLAQVDWLLDQSHRAPPVVDEGPVKPPRKRRVKRVPG